MTGSLDSRETGVKEAIRPAWLASGLEGIASRWVSVDGQRVHYLDAGSEADGPPWVMLHGNPTWSFLYRDIVRGLRPRLRCIVPDLPGFGLSVSKDQRPLRPAQHVEVLAGFLDVLGITRFRLMVHDWGGPIGLSVGVQRPDAITGLVIANTWAWPIGHRIHLAAFSRIFGGVLGRLLVDRWNALIEIGMRVGALRNPLGAAELDMYRGPFTEIRKRAAMRCLARELLASRDFLAGLECRLAALETTPALILWGDRDPAFGTVERRRFERLFPMHHTRILHGAGHFVQEDAGAEIAAAIATWCDRRAETDPPS